MSAGDLFSFEPPVEWFEECKGQTRDGRLVLIEASVLTSRWVARIPLFEGAVARRSHKTIAEARAAADKAVAESLA